MKKHIKEFLHRGLLAMGCGPVVLAIVYGILGAAGVITALSVNEVVLGVITVSLLAFVASGVTVLYKIEKLPLLYAVLIHGVTIYIDYAVIYIVNGWLADGALPFFIFTAAFVLGYILIWLIVYLFIRNDINRVNRKIEEHK